MGRGPDRKRNPGTKTEIGDKKASDAVDTILKGIRKSDAEKDKEIKDDPPKTDDTGEPPTDELGDVPKLGKRERLV